MLLIANLVLFFGLILPDLLSGRWLQALLGQSAAREWAIENYSMIPFDVMQGRRLHTLFTSMFLHFDLIHLGGNMLFLYVFGDNVEDALGHWRFLLFYFICGLAGSVLFISTDTYSVSRVIGASGAISGVLGAYMILYPRARILSLLLIGWLYIVPVPAAIFLGLWFVFQLLYGVLGPLGSAAEVAYWAHIGGFAAGLFFGMVWRGRRRIRDF